MTSPGYFLGAYVAAPADPAGAADFYARLADLPEVGGLELPFTGAPHAADQPPHRLAPHWRFVVTGLPGTVARADAEPRFGLASDDRDGRTAALAFAEQQRRAVHRLADARGAGAVRAVLIHSAPRGGSVEAFTRSLAELASWDWAGAALVVEHCDAVRPGRAPAKGYLTVAQELRALRASGAPELAAAVNWGRSAIESRGVEGPAEHLTALAAAGRLAGLVFSGCSDRDGAYGPAWADAHLPPAETFGESLLDARRARRALDAASGAWLFGAKFGVRPRSASAAERIALLQASLRALPTPAAGRSSEAAAGTRSPGAAAATRPRGTGPGTIVREAAGGAAAPPEAGSGPGPGPAHGPGPVSGPEARAGSGPGSGPAPQAETGPVPEAGSGPGPEPVSAPEPVSRPEPASAPGPAPDPAPANGTRPAPETHAGTPS